MATMLFLLQEAQRRGGRPGQEEEVRLDGQVGWDVSGQLLHQ